MSKTLWAESTSDLYQQLNVSAYADLAAAAGQVDLSVSVKVDYAREYKVNETQQSAALVWQDFDPIVALDYTYSQHLHLTEERLSNARIDPQSFTANCGNYIVVGIQEGYDYNAVARFMTRDVQSREDLSVTADLSIEAQQVSFSGGVTVDSLDEAKSTGASFSATEYGAIRPTEVGDPAAFRTKFNTISQNGPNGIVEKRVVKIFLAPVSSSVIRNFPSSGPLAITPKETTLRSLSATLWELNAAIEIADEALIQERTRPSSVPGQFAFGTTREKRQNYGNRLSRKLNRWKRIKSTLSQKAITCLKDYDNSCETVANQWDITGGTKGYALLKEFAWVPVKKPLNCENSYLQANMGEPLRLRFEGRGADRNIGRGPALVRARLSTYTRNDRQLFFRFKARIQEYKRHPNGRHNAIGLFDTRFSNSRTEKLVDLEGTGCRFIDTVGVSRHNQPRARDPFAGSSRQQYTGTIGAIKKLISDVPNTRVSYDKKSSEHDRHFRKINTPFPRNAGRGNALKEMKCWISNGHLAADTPVCEAFSTKKVLLKLQSVDDQEADRLSRNPQKVIKSLARMKLSKLKNAPRMRRRIAQAKTTAKRGKARAKRMRAATRKSTRKFSKRPKRRHIKSLKASSKKRPKSFRCKARVAACKKKKTPSAIGRCFKSVEKKAKTKGVKCTPKRAAKSCQKRCAKNRRRGTSKTKCLMGCLRSIKRFK